MKSLIYYYFLINTLVFILMYLDKRRAKKNLWRIKESNLFVLYFLGGFIGGFLGMFIFKHKTRKLKFYLAFIFSFIFHLIFYYFIISKFM